MNRILSGAAALLIALAGCGPAPDVSSSAGPDAKRLQPVQDSGRPEISAEKIARDITGRVVKVSDLRRAGPRTAWTFDADEFRQVEILERIVTEGGTTLVIFITTRNNPRPDEDAVQVSGKLQLQYKWRAGQWVLATVENLTFRYSIGVAT